MAAGASTALALAAAADLRPSGQGAVAGRKGAEQMRMILAFFALGAGAYVLSRRASNRADGTRAAFADDQPAGNGNPVRDAGPEAMRDPPAAPWSAVDEASDQSFPASDPPATY